jgi:AcrR family transcriptional regulator
MTRHLSEPERRAQILRAARSLFVENGFLATRMEDVAKRAQLSKGAVYFYYKSKRELFDALIDEEHARTLSFLEEAASDPRPAAEKLIELGWKYLDYFAGLKSPPRFFLLMSEMAIRDESIRDRATAIHQRFVDQVATFVAEGIEAGDFREQDPVAAAMMLKAFVDGLAGQSAIGIRPDVARMSTDGIRMILEGLAGRGATGAGVTDGTGTDG